MIIGRDMVVKLVLTTNFKRQAIQWDGATVLMKEPRGLIVKPDLNKRKICEVVMQTSETASMREAIERLVKIFDSTYAKAYHK